MTPKQMHHIVHLNGTFVELNFEKYRKGAIEHGSDLMDMDVLTLLKNIRDEALDTYVYTQTAIDQLEKERSGE